MFNSSSFFISCFFFLFVSIYIQVVVVGNLQHFISIILHFILHNHESEWICFVTFRVQDSHFFFDYSFACVFFGFHLQIQLKSCLIYKFLSIYTVRQFSISKEKKTIGKDICYGLNLSVKGFVFYIRIAFYTFKLFDGHQIGLVNSINSYRNWYD